MSALVLAGGTRALIRLVDGTDKERIASGVRRLSERSRYYRFLAPINQLTEKMLGYLTDIDNDDHLAWIAVDAGRPDEPVLGVARYVRRAAEPDVAEAAIVVSDDVQNRGLGWQLMVRLATSAQEHGVRVLRGWVLPENQVLRHALRVVGAKGRFEDGLLHAEVLVSEVLAAASARRTRAESREDE